MHRRGTNSCRSTQFRRHVDRPIDTRQRDGDDVRSPATPSVIVSDNVYTVQSVAIILDIIAGETITDDAPDGRSEPSNSSVTRQGVLIHSISPTTVLRERQFVFPKNGENPPPMSFNHPIRAIQKIKDEAIIMDPSIRHLLILLDGSSDSTFHHNKIRPPAIASPLHQRQLSGADWAAIKSPSATGDPSMTAASSNAKPAPARQRPIVDSRDPHPAFERRDGQVASSRWQITATHLPTNTIQDIINLTAATGKFAIINSNEMRT
ncbi:hypothetical protein ACLOJK_035698 [Asimina triloba]